MCLIVWNFGICKNFQVSRVLQSGFIHRRFSLFSLAAYSVGLASCIWMHLLWPCSFKFIEKGLPITSREVWPCASLDCCNRVGSLQNSVPGTPSGSILLPVCDTAYSCAHLTNRSQLTVSLLVSIWIQSRRKQVWASPFPRKRGVCGSDHSKRLWW